jgi:glucokinase
MTMRAQKTKARDVLLGVDIGGTKVLAGLVTSRGKILHSVRTPMAARKTAREGLQSVFDALDGIMGDPRAKRARSVGVSVPGWVDAVRGVVHSAPNISCWRNFPLAREIQRRYGLPVRIENDANAAVLAETVWGPGAKHANVFYVTVGTGIGTGIVLHQRLHSGRTGGASEGGHVTIDFNGPRCGCGKRGCIEAYVSGTAIACRARELLSKPGTRSSKILKAAGGKLDAVKAEHVAKAARQGDRLATQILNDAADHFAIWLGGVIDMLEPDVIIIGGGMASLMMSLLPRIRRGLRTWAANPRRHEIPIVRAHFGADSALAGGAALTIR